MAKLSSTTKNRTLGESNRPGYTLVEAMMASVLLAISVVGVSGAITASYANQRYSQEKQMALASGTKLMDELTTLPMDQPASNRVGLSDFSSYSDSVDAESSASAVMAKQAAVQDSNSGGDDSGDSGSSGGSGHSGGLLGGLLGGLIDTVTDILGGGGSGSSGSGSSGSGSSGSSGSNTASSTDTSVNMTHADTPNAIASRTVSIDRKSSLTGGADSNGDFAVVSVTVDVGDGQKVKVKRLVTSAEAATNAAATSSN